MLHVRPDNRTSSIILLAVLVGILAMAGAASAECLPGQLSESSLVYSKSKDALAAEHYEEAISQLLSALSICEEHIDANRDLGRAYFGLGKYEMAVKYYQRTIELSVDQPEPGNFSLLAKTYTTMKKYKEARAEYMKADQLRPNDFGVLFNLGVVSRESGYLIDAVEVFERALTISPEKYRGAVLTNLADSATKAAAQQKANGNSDKAKFYAEKAERYGGQAGGSTTYDMVTKKMEEKDYRGAVTLLESLVEKNPDDSKSWLTLARAKDGMGNKTGSIQAYQKYISLEPGKTKPVAAMLQVMVEAGDCTAAKNAAKDATIRFASEDKAKLAPIWYSYGLALECLGDFDAAKVQFSHCANSGNARYSGYGATQVKRMTDLKAQADAKQKKADQGR